MTTSPAAPTTRTVQGVALTEQATGVDSPSAPVVLVHGGCHGSWQWAPTQQWLAAGGRSSIALDWFSHGGSRGLEHDEWLQRGIPAVRTEIGIAVDEADRLPVLMGHSMGGLASLAFAASHPGALSALVLLAPVVPSQFAGDAIDLPIDMNAPWGPPPPNQARHLFYSGVSDVEAAGIYPLLQAESPTAVFEATRWRAEVDLSELDVPVLVVVGDADPLTPCDVVSGLARGIGAELVVLPDIGHGITFDPSWPDVRERIETWLGSVSGR